MKSVIGFTERHKGSYTEEIFKKLSEMNFRYYSSATQFIIVMFEGKWTPYEDVVKCVKGLPPVRYKED